MHTTHRHGSKPGTPQRKAPEPARVRALRDRPRFFDFSRPAKTVVTGFARLENPPIGVHDLRFVTGLRRRMHGVGCGHELAFGLIEFSRLFPDPRLCLGGWIVGVRPEMRPGPIPFGHESRRQHRKLCRIDVAILDHLGHGLVGTKYGLESLLPGFDWLPGTCVFGLTAARQQRTHQQKRKKGAQHVNGQFKINGWGVMDRRTASIERSVSPPRLAGRQERARTVPCPGPFI